MKIEFATDRARQPKKHFVASKGSNRAVKSANRKNKRNIIMNGLSDSFWECPRCNRGAMLNIKTCKGCGYVYLSDEIAAHEKKTKPKPKPEKRKDILNPKIRATSGNESPVISTLFLRK